MKKQKSQVVISGETTVEMAKAAKELIKRMTKANTFECMELETENIYAVTTYRRTGIGYRIEPVNRKCNLQRISPLTITVTMKDNFSAPELKVEFLAEGCVDNRMAMAKIKAYGKCENDWHLWDNATESGTPNAPFADVYFYEE